MPKKLLDSNRFLLFSPCPANFYLLWGCMLKGKEIFSLGLHSAWEQKLGIGPVYRAIILYYTDDYWSFFADETQKG